VNSFNWLNPIDSALLDSPHQYEKKYYWVFLFLVTLLFPLDVNDVTDVVHLSFDNFGVFFKVTSSIHY